MAILIETMRREGYEFMVSKPQVITKSENDKVLESARGNPGVFDSTVAILAQGTPSG